ncbi:outer membrane protein TolC [Paraburkholderia graminis]|uniref:Outer membrane protein TolC n=1 Tax=Paraburkholderia graminis TaxID=60548 RepID=A0ABD5CC82_9BURK|nr:outer membrane protein TolC [Paraburkholderia graminis]
MTHRTYDSRLQSSIAATGQRCRRASALARLAQLTLTVALAGCTSYAPRPLPEAPQWSHDIAATDAPLTVDQVVERALKQSPDIRLAERELDVATAKEYADGLLPDPTLTFSTDRPGAAGFVPAFMAGLSYEVSALVDRPAKKRAAAKASEKQQLALDWVRWQVANRAYALYVTNVSLQRLEGDVGQLVAYQRDDTERLQKALGRSDVTRDTALLAEVAYGDTVQQLGTLRQERLKAERELARLLDLPPGSQLALAAPPQPTEVPQHLIVGALLNLGQRRPDLLALRAGYDEQDEHYRAALFAQFPRLDVGVTRGRDTSAIYTSGLSVSVTLPLFNGNRGNIAVEKATRESLYQEYGQRLDDAYTAVDAISSELTWLTERLHNSQSTEAALDASLKKLRVAYAAHDVSFPVLADAEVRLLNQRVATTKLANSVLQQQVELCTLIGVSAIDHQPLQ